MIIGIYIAKAAFNISEILRYYKAQTLLLVKIARAQGVDEKEIDRVLSVLQPKEGVYPAFTEDYLPIRKLDTQDSDGAHFPHSQKPDVKN